MKNIFLQLQINLYQIRLLRIIFKPKIYVICDKCEFLSPYFSITTKFLNLIVNLKDWPLVFSALLVKIMITIIVNSFFTQINCKCMPLNVGIKLFICEENEHFFPCAQLKTQTCFEAVQAVRVPKHLRHQKYFLFMSIHLKLR